MYYSRRYLSYLSIVAMLAAAPAVAQESNSAPAAQPGQLAVPPGAYREWPGAPALANRPETAGSMVDSEGSGAIPALPLEVQTQGGITYITGGIGDEEIAQLKASEKEYNLRMLMSAPGGAFVSDVSLHAVDATGKEVLAVDSAGPYFYARLPAGAYTVTLNGHGESKKIAVKIKEGGSVRQMVQFKEQGGVTTTHQPTATVD